jgi:hypothetical protein
MEILRMTLNSSVWPTVPLEQALDSVTRAGVRSLNDNGVRMVIGCSVCPSGPESKSRLRTRKLSDVRFGS